MRTIWMAGLLGLAACGAPATPEPKTPQAGSTDAATAEGGAKGTPPSALPKVDAFALPEHGRDEAPVTPEPAALSLEGWSKASKVKGVAPSPAACSAFRNRTAVKTSPSDLDRALAETDASKRDAMLLGLEGAPAPLGRELVRALRADLAPVECADVLVDPLLASKQQVEGKVGHVLVGLSLASKLARTAATVPTMGAARDKAAVLAFIKGPLRTWMVEQATAIETLSAGAAGLGGYGRGIAAVEAGSADLRLVDKMRGAPVPASWDQEIKGIYEASLDEALEPRKARGRDAALVGLADFAQSGALGDARVQRARQLLSKLYGGRRIDALDGLIVPSNTPPSSNEHAAAVSAVNPFWADRLWTKESWTSFGRGLPESIRAHARTGDLPAEARSAYARARLDLGRTYWRKVDFVEAAHAAKPSAAPLDRLTLALALDLAHGPDSARAMMGAAQPEILDLDHTEALDALVIDRGPLAGVAAFDAAHLRSLSPPSGDRAPAYLRDVAVRFANAAKLLEDPGQKKLAEERSKEAESLAAAATGAAH